MRHLAKLSILLFAITLAHSTLSSQAYTFQYTEQGQQIYQDIIDLKLDKATESLDERIKAEPYNLSYLHLYSYKDFFQLFISEDEAYFKQAQKKKESYLHQLRSRLPDDNPYKKFALAEIQLHSAINRSKFDQLFKSAKEILSAYNLLKENQSAFPDFILNKKSLSVIHSLAETVSIPSILKKLFGINGSLQQGLSEIEEVISYSHAKPGFLFKEEVDAIYLYILMYQANDKAAALAYLKKARLQPKTSLLSAFLVSKIYQRSGLNEKALSTLEGKPVGADYASFPYMDLQIGLCKLRKLDPTALAHIRIYLENFQGRHYIKEAYQKLAWSKLVFEEDIPGYKYYLSQVKKQGHDLVDGDQQAKREEASHEMPDPDLLRARLLSDGGYHEKAYALLVQKAYRYTGASKYAIEFSYRMGRITQALKNYPEALENYRVTIDNGAEQPMYFACSAALNTGLIYESIREYEKAIASYTACLKINPKEYKKSLHQKARSGLQRLEER